jgi:hypothetical protein
LIWDGKTKDFGLNNSKHSLNLVNSWFHHECHSDLLVLSPSIWMLHYDVKTCWRSETTAPLIRNLGSRCRFSV